MKTLEYNSKRFTNWLLNLWPFCLDADSIKPIFALCIGCKQDGKWSSWFSWIGNKNEDSLFYNGVIYIRFMLPFWVGVQIRWRGYDPFSKEFLQTGIGWKGNGRIALLFRIQSDLSGAEGMTGHNYGQAIGWQCGAK